MKNIKMSPDRHERIYTISDFGVNDEICTKQCKKRTKYSCIFLALCALTGLVIYLAVHYELLNVVTVNCKTELEHMSRNESVLRANIGELKQKNAELNQELKAVKIDLAHTEELYAAAQDKIEIYLKTIKELKETLNLQISTDFLTNEHKSQGASISPRSSYLLLMLVGLYYYIM